MRSGPPPLKLRGVDIAAGRSASRVAHAGAQGGLADRYHDGPPPPWRAPLIPPRGMARHPAPAPRSPRALRVQPRS